MPKLKTHHWTGVTCAMKNFFGVMPGIVYGWPKNVLHYAGIENSILDINADNAVGLLYRISRLISQKRCEIDLVLISTEGHKAIDVFHITRAGAKLSDKALQRLAGDLQRLLEGHHEVA